MAKFTEDDPCSETNSSLALGLEKSITDMVSDTRGTVQQDISRTGSDSETGLTSNICDGPDFSILVPETRSSASPTSSSPGSSPGSPGAVKHDRPHIISDSGCDQWDGFLSPILPLTTASNSKPACKLSSQITGDRTKVTPSAEEFTTPLRRFTYDFINSDSASAGMAGDILSTHHKCNAVSQGSTRLPTDSVHTPAANTPGLAPPGYRDETIGLDSGYGSFTALPCKMGRKEMDIIAELHKHDPALVAMVMAYFSPKDVIRFSGVCRKWRRLVESHGNAALKKRQFLLQHKQRSSKKENFPYPKQTPKRSTVSASTPLGEVQEFGVPQATSTPATSLSSHDKFVKASDSLLGDDSLTRCAKGDCCFPAKLLMNKQRAQCSRCGYDFCTNCLGVFHHGSPCDTLRRKNTARNSGGVGSSKSRSSLRRLVRLDRK